MLELKAKAEEEKVADGKEAIRYIKELEDKNKEISALKQELETMKKTYEVQCSQLKAIIEEEKIADGNESIRHIKELEEKNMEISAFKQELETMKKAHEVQCSQLKANAEEEKVMGGKEIIKYTKELEDKNMEISAFKQELETMKETYEVQCSQLKAKADEEKMVNEKEIMKYTKELEDKIMEISSFKQELETTKKTHEVQCSQWEAKVEDGKEELKQKSQEYENLLEKLRNKVKENETLYESKYRSGSEREADTKRCEFSVQFHTGVNLKSLVEAAENYQIVLAENRKLFNEVQELKVYCRLRPFLPGQKEKQSIVEHVGENDLVVANLAKQGKEALRTFKFNKVFGPTSTQAGCMPTYKPLFDRYWMGLMYVYLLMVKLVQCKTYTMSGPNNASIEDLGVNYRALE
ncbi:hypothetical protein ACSQ67_009366 [Phaseolus vulgaris]